MWYASECTANWEAYAFFCCCLLCCIFCVVAVRILWFLFLWIILASNGMLDTHSAISTSQRDETIIILLMGISDRSISHFKMLATNATNIMLWLWWRQRIEKQSDECVWVWFRTMLYCSHGMFLKWAIVAVNLCCVSIDAMRPKT